MLSLVAHALSPVIYFFITPKMFALNFDFTVLTLVYIYSIDLGGYKKYSIRIQVWLKGLGSSCWDRGNLSNHTPSNGSILGRCFQDQNQVLY